MSPHTTVHTVQVICANCMVCYTAAETPQIIWFASSQMFFFNPSMYVLDCSMLVGMAYCGHCPLSQVFSHTVYCKLDLFLLLDGIGKIIPPDTTLSVFYSNHNSALVYLTVTLVKRIIYVSLIMTHFKDFGMKYTTCFGLRRPL